MSPNKKKKNILARVGTTIAAIVLAGCSVTPKPIAEADHKARAESDSAKMYSAQQPLSGKITLAEATARAISYNMDYRLRMMEEAYAFGQLDVANFDMLPKVTASAGYSNRNNDSFGKGFSTDGTIGSTYNAASEREVVTTKAGISWSVLDFGLSYFRAKQLADQTLVAEERRRKAMQNLVLDVRQAFWKAYIAQQLLPEMGKLLTELDKNSARAKVILAQKLLTPLQIIAYRRSLIDLEQQLALRASDLAQARVEFAQLINLPPDQPYVLEAPGTDGVVREFVGKIDVLDQLALELRPELREEGYRIRMSEIDKVRAQLQALLPGVSVDYSYNTNSNKYLLNRSWTSVGADAAINLVKVFSLPALNRAAESQKGMDEARRMAQVAAVLAQVRIAVTRYEVLGREYEYWLDAIDDDKRFLDTLTSSASVGIETELELIRAKAKLIGTRASAGLAYATLEGAMGRIYNSVGLDVLPREMKRNDLQALTTELDQRVKAWEDANFGERKPLALPKVAIAYTPRVNADAKKAITQTIGSIFKGASIEVANDADLVLTTDIEVTGEPGKKIVGRIQGRLLNKDEQVVFETEQQSTLTDPITPKQWSALGEAIGMKVSEALQAQARKPLPKALQDN